MTDMLLLWILLCGTGFLTDASQVVDPNPPSSEPENLFVYFKEVPSPVFYTTNIPVIFEFKTPNWKEDQLRVQWPSGHSTNCNNTDAVSHYSQTGCPSVYHFNKVIQSFFSKTTPQVFDEMGRLFTSVPTMPIPCDQILPHFRESSETSEGVSWERYWEILSSCQLRDFHKESVNQDFATLDLSRLKTMLAHFWNTYAVSVYSHYSSVGGSVYTNAYSAYQTMALLEYYEEVQRWSDAVSHCKNRLLPLSLVSHTMFQQVLKSVKQKIASKSMTLSMESSDIHFKLPITDCTYAQNNNSLVVRMLAPLRPSTSNYKLFSVLAVPFTRNFNTSNSVNLVCQAEQEASNYVFNSHSGFLQKSNCNADELCYIDEKYISKSEDCISVASNTNGSLIFGERCKFSCRSVSTHQFPMFLRLDSSLIAVLGFSKENDVFISCRGNPFKVIKPNETGTFLIQLPCDCKVVYHHQEFHAYQPCNLPIRTWNVNTNLLDKGTTEASASDDDETTETTIEEAVGAKGLPNRADEIQNQHHIVPWLGLIFGLFGFLAFLWLVVERVWGKRRYNDEDGLYATVAYTSSDNNKVLRGGVDNPVARLMVKDMQ